MGEVWLADDDEDDLLFMQDALEAVGLESRDVLCFMDGQALLEKVLSRAQSEQSLPAVLFLDGRMPKLNGIEVVKALHARGLLKRLRIVLLGGSFTARELSIATACQVACYNKPGSLADLKRLLREILADLPEQVS